MCTGTISVDVVRDVWENPLRNRKLHRALRCTRIDSLGPTLPRHLSRFRPQSKFLIFLHLCIGFFIFSAEQRISYFLCFRKFFRFFKCFIGDNVDLRLRELECLCPSGSLTIPRDLIHPQDFSGLSFAPDIEEAAFGFFANRFRARGTHGRAAALFFQEFRPSLRCVPEKRASVARYTHTRH